MNKEEIITLLAKENLSPQKRKGQNFLVDENVARKIVSFLEPNYIDVIEVGPGLGALTKELLLKTVNFTAIEIDKGFVRVLRAKYPHLNIIEKDFLEYSVPRETKAIISNIPYYITTKIIEKVLLEAENLKKFVFMTQIDVKERLLAKSGTKAYSPLRVLLSLLGDVEQKLVVTADKFYPVPHVDSAVFCFTRYKTDIPVREFYSFLNNAFLNRRKTLYNNLKNIYDKEDILTALKKHRINENVRAEALSPNDLLTLFETLR
ncbi:MAG: 16S rRNA (adenine(1518)-N(6)/adenine(1519)-N(6))-dimethyltransferase RsmA [Bacilli bacterium]|nr:16S rRNA (adenine(1518)-N(6)/adenine(1519)-N(6))-dimethyltransferase RsmA [Bacillota bacterium]OQC50327.1 MAG: Ribosomal RNA small subunit methyltransferase A [Tenericutes bacterium ADurb.Bin024]HOA10934.1 16S rRNA (adenine(1518)-N(6)/adenine(1519)-N(6))-dimethyltransferase RsmA [Bacilli bacterium]HOM31984.1 16S rRNA (adenine(1518)-N(6)/adenine(1519)-N(6))-dimethyltransferase RsmA [Bacilli bacterium]HQB96306.1 16S rRNA (adenine(1518)-N(6)/adenine(1519)-N(6))-dimethyltransferase RsmA [Bacilli